MAVAKTTYIIRPSEKTDGPELFDMLLKYNNFKHDHLDTSVAMVTELAGSKEMLTVTQDGEITGFFLVTDVTNGLHCYAHFLCKPDHWRGWNDDNVFESWLDTVWARYNVVKLKVSVMASQVEQDTPAKNADGKVIKRLRPLGKLLKRLKFFRLWMQVDEFMVNGKLVTGIAYELRRAFWHRERKRSGAKP